MIDHESPLIHPTAIVDSQAQVGKNVQIGPYSIIEANTSIGDNTRLGPHVYLAAGAHVGTDCIIHKSAVLGTEPQDLKFKGETSRVVVGDRTTIREFATLHRGTEDGDLLTTVGSDCLLMAYSHVAHDCHVGNNVILANSATMAGHVTIEDNVIVSGLSVIHQFCRIGQHAYIGGLGRISKDIPPYVITLGDSYNGLNSVGLKRRGFTSEQINRIKHTYKLIYRSGLNLTQAVEAIKSDMEITSEVQIILDFIEKSERGLLGG